jgi:hypothetical protein
VICARCGATYVTIACPACTKRLNRVIALRSQPPVEPVRPIRWARLNYSGGRKLWHTVRKGHVLALCGLVHFDHPRAQFSELKPESGKLCQLCVAKLERAA